MMSQDRRIHHGYTVSLDPLRAKRRYLTDSGTGHQWYLQRGEGIETEERLLEEYGTAIHLKGPLGVRFFSWLKPGVIGCSRWCIAQEDRLWIADPKAVHHILQGSGYLYGKLSSTREFFVPLLGKGLVWAEGESSLMLYSVTPNPETRRCTQTAEESHGSRIRSRRSQGLVPLLRPMY